MLWGIATIASLAGAAYLGWSLGGACAALLSVIFIGYLTPQILLSFLPAQDLKKKYGAEWGLVTGSSSGIGRAIAERLLQQGVNVVLVALPEPLLDEAHAALRGQFPDREVRKVAVNLGKPGYMETIAEQTKDIPVSIVFNNAGYMLTGFFDQSPLDRQMCNLECNAVAGIQISHLFVGRMLDAGLRGCVVFTSSAAMCMPSPFTSLYSSTKAFVSTFVAGLSAEVRSRGIDVMSVHPSPVNTRFYSQKGNHQLDAVDFFKKFAVPPEALPTHIFAAVGRCVWLDIGAWAMIFRLMMKVLDYNCFATLTAGFAHTMGDFQRHLPKAAAAGRRAPQKVQSP